jgi:uncharacterized protein
MLPSHLQPQGLAIEVVFSPAARELRQERLQLPAGATVGDAVQAALAAWGLAWPQGAVVAVWGRKVAADQLLREGDRVEILRPLQVDPKEARRLRYRRLGEKGRTARPRKATDPGGA